jgi:hypothetical protein
MPMPDALKKYGRKLIIALMNFQRSSPIKKFKTIYGEVHRGRTCF